MKKFYLFATSLVLVLSSCSNNSNNADVEIPEGNIKPLSLLVDIETPATRNGSVSVISGEVTTDNLSQIGVHICEDGKFGAAYIGGSHNTTWTKSDNGWTATTPIYLGSKNANVYAYHPYSNSADLNVAAIPVAVGNTDYLFGKAEKDDATIFVANNQNTTASIKMKHAMSQIIWNFTKNQNYTGDANVDSIKLSSLHENGTLNINTGEIVADNGEEYILSNVLTIGTTKTSKNLMIIPTDYSENQISMEIIIDGKKLTTNINTNFERSKKYNFNINVSGTGISIGEVLVENWTTGGDSNIEFE